jgi:hypothetical protein
MGKAVLRLGNSPLEVPVDDGSGTLATHRALDWNDSPVNHIMVLNQPTATLCTGDMPSDNLEELGYSVFLPGLTRPGN